MFLASGPESSHAQSCEKAPVSYLSFGTGWNFSCCEAKFPPLRCAGFTMTEELRAVMGETAGDDIRHGLAIELVPNCSLTPAQAFGFFASLCFVSFTVAGYFAAQGLWPVLPFAGLEMAVLGWALNVSLRRRRCTQTITLTEDEVRIVTRDACGARSMAFPRHWASPRLVRARGWHPSRLVIESHGRACEVGGLLTEEERRSLHARLQRVVGMVNESPRLQAAVNP